MAFLAIRRAVAVAVIVSSTADRLIRVQAALFLCFISRPDPNWWYNFRFVLPPLVTL